ncbi:MAG: hypothetical protein MJB57_10015 [Gemmatimonadetes bacterium]|nr:hypothetical protein [Gemmatimonadota bacterium]
MKKRITSLAVAVFLVFAGPASAQLWVGANLTSPTSDFGDIADTGWMGNVGYLIPLGEGGLGFAPEVYYGSNGHSDSDDKTNLYGANANLGFSFGTGNVMPFIFGSVGILAHQFSPDEGDGETETGISFGAGGGLDFGRFGVEGKFLTASTGEDGADATTAVLIFGAFVKIGG